MIYRIDTYNYALPDERIAKFPLEKRDESKLLLYGKDGISHTIFKNIADFLPENTLMIFNNTKVIQARIVFQKITGAQIEIFCLEPYEPQDYLLAFQTTSKCTWKCLIGNAKRWKKETISQNFSTADENTTLCARKLSFDGKAYLIEFSWDNQALSFAEILDRIGQLPIPPYLHREACEQDKTSYQTVYSKIKGSVAAPTAGLHFTEEVFNSFKKKNISCEEITLHVGAGTFLPVKSATIDGHEMHTEFFSVQKSVLEQIKEKTGSIIAVGTTSVRTLESLYYIGILLEENPELLAEERIHVSQWTPYHVKEKLSITQSLENILNYLERNNLETLKAETQILLMPGYRFKIVKGMVTNFHQPQSTLLLLIAAFVGDDWKKIYDYALDNDFRFLSYGDSSLLF